MFALSPGMRRKNCEHPRPTTRGFSTSSLERPPILNSNTVSILRGIDDSEDARSGPITRAGAGQEEVRTTTRSRRVAAGSLACCRCDAPVALTAGPVAMTDALTCPFCAHSAPVRDFLSLADPTRPARVVVRVR